MSNLGLDCEGVLVRVIHYKRAITRQEQLKPTTGKATLLYQTSFSTFYDHGPLRLESSESDLRPSRFKSVIILLNILHSWSLLMASYVCYYLWGLDRSMIILLSTFTRRSDLQAIVLELC